VLEFKTLYNLSYYPLYCFDFDKWMDRIRKDNVYLIEKVKNLEEYFINDLMKRLFSLLKEI
jgi:hypothetical protein